MRSNSFVIPRVILFVAAVCLSGTGFKIIGQDTAQKPTTQKAATPAAKTAEQQFKNIKILKGIPADQLIPSMQFISASLGVDCEYCHVEHQMDKDDKKPKEAARKMMTMMFAINADSFEGERKVTCNSCHHGSPHPASTPPVASGTAMSTVHEHESDHGSAATQPKATDILDKYLAAVGGPDALKKIHSRVQKGSLEATGNAYPIEVYSVAPDKRISISHPPNAESVTAYNGEVGWLTLRGGIHRMSTADAAAARIDAELFFPARVREMYTKFEVRSGEPVAGHATVLVAASGEGNPPLELYFDAESGLLLRMVRYGETPLGRNPTQIDYADYRVVDGVKIPYQWTVARPNGAFTIKIDKAEQNVPVDEKLFVAPAEQPPPPPNPPH
jgi:photosynthetic reaction center cytochrome c subunit